MRKRIAVVGSSQVWRRGIASVLDDAGFDTVDYESLDLWTPGHGGSAVMCRIDATDSIAAFVQAHPYIPVLTVAETLDIVGYAAAVTSGATSVIAENANPERFRLVIEAAIDAQAVVPVELIRAMAKRVPNVDDYRVWLSPEHVDQLRQLAAGVTVAAMADLAVYSEREMFRMLQELYTTIGVGNRTEAIIWATRHGVLDETEPD